VLSWNNLGERTNVEIIVKRAADGSNGIVKRSNWTSGFREE
jgi:hypothetical protein